jgi:uncharacterized membrane-anchored protein
VKRPLAFLLCVAPQFLVVAAVVAREEVALHAGVEVRLEVRAVDPMSLFAGRYISVPLAIQRLDKTVHVEPGIEPNQTVYVRLARGEPFWSAVDVTREPPRATGDVFLRGTWIESNRVSYGIDTFYIPEDGADPSRLALTAVVRVTREGRGLIEDLLVGKQTYAQWNAAQKSR